jgi:ABC-type bacteriocin/lantibiotic exporter with double-glycine peptidase domain
MAIILSLLFVFWSKKAIDLALGDDDTALHVALSFSVVCVFAGFLTRMYTSWVNERTRMRLIIYLQNAVVKSQMLSTWKFIKQWHTGDIQTRVNTDCQEIVQMISYGSLGFLLTVIKLFASFGFLWLMDPMLALLILAVSPLFLFSKLYFKKLRYLNRKLKQAESVFGNVVQENLRFRMSIRALGLQFIRWRKVEESQEDVLGFKSKLLNFSTVSQGLMKMSIHVGFLLTFVWGVYRLHSGEISFGMIQSPILLLMGFIPQFIRFRTSVDRVREILEIEVEEEVGQLYVADPQCIRIKQLRFCYADIPIIDRLDAEIHTGQPVAIIGSSGKGKTTLIRLLLALIKPDEGQILLRTRENEFLLSNQHRVNIAYVPQGDRLFSGSIRENLQTTEDILSDESLREALYLACAEFVYDLPEGLDTIIGESGYGLSEGQAQRIAIARALTRPCNIWLFDEVTSALDTVTAKKLMYRLIQAGKERILVFVTHDLALATQCSQTIYI